MSLNHFDAIAYINLNHRKDRKTLLLKELEKLKIDKIKIKRISGHYTPFNGHIGCVLSHIETLKWATEQKLENIVILEDDCYFLDNVKFIDFCIEYFIKLVDKWDVYLFGGYFHKIEESKYPYINRVIRSIRAHAYVVNKSYFVKLKNHFEKTYVLLKDHTYHLGCHEYVLDQRWHIMQKKHLWYTGNIILAGQRKDYSDILWKPREKR